MLQHNPITPQALSRGDGAWGKSPSRMGMATPPPPPAYAPPPYFCAMPLKKGEEQRTSRTVAATPARNDAGSPPPPDYNWATSQRQRQEEQEGQRQQQEQQQEQQQRRNEIFISDGESSIRSVQTPRAPASPKVAPKIDWRGFDKAPASGGRELATRKCAFKIFVIFRGGWCMSSHALLRGFVELNPAIKRAGGKVVAISSQTPEQVGRMANDLKLPFQAFGDPSNGLVEEMNRRFKMDCMVSRNAMVTDAYPHGMAQPCVLAVYGDEAQDEGSVLFKWNQWQTIASMRHADAWAQTKQAFSAKTQNSVRPEAGATGGGSMPRSSPPLRPKARNAAPSPFASGRAPFADQVIDAEAAIPPPSTVRATAATVAAAAAAAEQRSPHRARTIEEAVDSALGVGWMKTGRDRAASAPRGAAAPGGGATPRSRPRSTPRGAVSKASRGEAFFPEQMAAPRRGFEDAEGAADSRERERRVASLPEQQGRGRAVEGGSDENRWQPVSPGRKHLRPRTLPRPSVRPPGSSAPGPAGLPPQHRRPTQAATGAGVIGGRKTRPPRHTVSVDDGSSSGSSAAPQPLPPPQPQPQALQKKGTAMSGSSRRFWFGSSSGSSRRSSFEEAATDFNEGGRGGAKNGRDFASAPGGRGGGEGLTVEGEPAVPPSPASRWGYLRKGVRPTSTPKPVAR
eukprot:g13887.t1